MFKKLNLQLFAEGEPGIVDVEVNDNNDDQDDNDNPGQLPLPPAVINANPNPLMPSALPAEAWRNVEELLVTLSNNVRVNAATQNAKIETLTNETVEAIHELRSAVSTLTQQMNQFNALIEAATVEVPAPPNDDETKPKQRQGGYLSHRSRK